jgi:hypothetical protein
VNLLVLFLAFPVASPPQGPPVLSEFLAVNTDGLEDEDGDNPDWLEIHNPFFPDVDIGGWFLTDDSADLTKWAFPPSTLVTSGGFLVVFASDKNRAVTGGELHTNFKLASGGDFLALVEPDGITVASAFSPAYPEQFEDVSYGFGFNPSVTTQLHWFAEPTPGAPNGAGGPLILDPGFSPQVPTLTDPVVVFATLPGFPAQATLHTRVLYRTESSLGMVDDGTGGDAVAGDGVWTGVIPAATASMGQMLRWRIQVTDGSGNASISPPFNDPNKEPEYHGTMVQDTSWSSFLPALHWFVENPSAAGNPNGTRCSVFWEDTLYDNILVRPRGGSSTWWPKKSFKFDFNPDFRLRIDPDLRKVDEINVQSSYSDKSYLRQILCWETYEKAGVQGCFCFPVRMQQNGQFHSVAFLLEQPDEDLLDRHGLDPEGALYKMYNQATSAYSGVEKKTRLHEDNSDLAAFIAGILQSGQARYDFLFDNADLPSIISYIAATTLIHDNDHIAKNYYLYRDSDGDGEWRVLPWDKDLTLGRNYTLGGGVLNDTMWADDDPYSHPLFGDSSHRKVDGWWNRLVDACHDSPRIREMYLRRLRTLMEEILQSPTTPTSQLDFESRITNLQAAMDPDVTLDIANWGIPTWGSQMNFQAGIDQLIQDYIEVRRGHLFNTHSVPGGGIIPATASPAPPMGFGFIEAEPVSGDQDEEFIQIINPGGEAVDISGWTLEGGVSFIFDPGTVVPSDDSVLVSPNLATFRARATPPSAGQGIFVVGPYDRHLAPGEELHLFDKEGALVTSTGGPALVVRGLEAGGTALLTVVGATPMAFQHYAFSLTGSGPTTSPYGDLALSPPIQLAGMVRADSLGNATKSAAVPPGTSGLVVWLQALDAGTLTLTNGVQITIP